MTTALILVGHGSHITPETAGVIWRHVDLLRELGIADEITAAFWKEAPPFHGVLNTLIADDVTIVPMFTANGYFTQTVIPTEMGLSGSITQRHGRMIRYTPPLNEHAHLFTIVRSRVDSAMAQHALDPDQTAVVVIGHSTRRNRESRQATEVQAKRLQSDGAAAEVVAVYLDDAPEIADLYTLTTAPNVIAVPYFLAAGSHTTIDVPRAIGLADGSKSEVIHGRHIVYTPPIGANDDLLEVVIALARNAGAPLYKPSVGSSWRDFPLAGRHLLVETMRGCGEMRFGDLRLTPNSVCVWDDPHPDVLITTPAELRKWVRESPFRSLAVSDDLPNGWRVEVPNEEQLHAVVETIYPGALADWAAAQSGTLAISSLTQITARQTGMYRALGLLSNDEQALVVESVCGRCVRQPTWFREAAAHAIPCPEPCNHWLSAALEAQS